MSDGGGMLFLESVAHAEARGARVLARIRGYASMSEAHHLTSPEPSGESAEATGADFVPVVAAQAGETAGADATSCIEIVAGSVLVRVPMGVDARTLAAILRAVR